MELQSRRIGGIRWFCTIAPWLNGTVVQDLTIDADKVTHVVCRKPVNFGRVALNFSLCDGQRMPFRLLENCSQRRMESYRIPALSG